MLNCAHAGLIRKDSHMKIAVVGLGYVGLPLSLQFARAGVEVLGLDIDKKKVDALNAGKSYIKHIEAADIAEAVNSEPSRLPWSSPGLVKPKLLSSACRRRLIKIENRISVT